MDMCLFIESNEQGEDDEVEAFPKQVMHKASVIISATGDAIAIFGELQCLIPRCYKYLNSVCLATNLSIVLCIHIMNKV